MGSIWYSFGPLSQFCSCSNQHPLHKIAKAFGVMFFLFFFFFPFHLIKGRLGETTWPWQTWSCTMEITLVCGWGEKEEEND